MIDLLKQKFTDTYAMSKWYMGQTESKSGMGSSMKFTENIRKDLPMLIDEYNISSVFDCSCGDWNWMKHISKSFNRYVGNDIVQELVDINTKNFSNENISFICGDMVSSMKLFKDKEFDLTICRHTLEHLPTSYITDVLNEIKRVSKFALITSTDLYQTNIDQDMADIRFVLDGVSYRPINLEVSFYYSILGNPINKLKEFSDEEPNGKTCYTYLYRFD